MCVCVFPYTPFLGKVSCAPQHERSMLASSTEVFVRNKTLGSSPASLDQKLPKIGVKNAARPCIEEGGGVEFTQITVFFF